MKGKSLAKIAAIVCAVGVFASALVWRQSGLAATYVEKRGTAQYSGIRITLDGEVVEPKDVTGKVVELFIVDGTTYLPIRAIAAALGIDVDWNQETQTVFLQAQKKTVFDFSPASYIQLKTDSEMMDILGLSEDDVVRDRGTVTIGKASFGGRSLTSSCHSAHTQTRRRIQLRSTPQICCNTLQAWTIVSRFRRI